MPTAIPRNAALAGPSESWSSTGTETPRDGIIAGSGDLEGVALGWRNGSYLGVLLVALGAALWGTDAVLRVPLLEVMSPSAIVLSERLVLLLYSAPAVALGWRVILNL